MRKLRKLTLYFTALVMIMLTIMSSFAQGGYTDVSDDAWYAEAVRYVTDNKVMSGTSNSKFSPDLVVTRATLATVLYRMSGSPSVNGDDNFTDTRKNHWYSNAINWASANGVIEGLGNGIFAPDQTLNREQLLSVIWRYAGQPSATQGDTSYDDSNVSSWAKSAVLWARTNDIAAQNNGGQFNPKGDVTRGELAAVLTNYLKKADTTNTNINTDKNTNTKETDNTAKNTSTGKKVLVVYYSQTGTTKRLAEEIAKQTNGDLVELKPKTPYTDDDVNYTNPDSRVVKEHNQMPNVKVELENTKVPNFENYDTVFIGAPIWWRELAWVVDDFVRENDFTGKKMIAFSTSMSTGDSDSGKRLEGYTKNGQWLKGQRFPTSFSSDDVKNWLGTLNY